MEKWHELLKTAIDNKMIIGIAITEEHIEYCARARTLFSEYNNHFYNSELPTTDIFFSLTGSAGEYCSKSLKLWYGTTSEHSIVICPDEIENEEQLKEVLLHEMAHEYCDIHKIKDMDRANHTREFAEVCLAHGLTYKDGEKDYSNTILQKGGEAWK